MMFLLIGLGAVFSSPAPAPAAGSEWARLEHVSLRLISADNALPGEEARLGLYFQLEDDWKIYWRSPGDAGFPPQIDWSGSRNLADVEILWPAPVRFSAAGFETIGYKHEVVLPLLARLENPGRDVALRGNVDFLACAEICIPYQVDLALDLPGGEAITSSPEAALIDLYQAQVPGNGAAHGLTLEPIVGLIPGEKPVLLAAAQGMAPFEAPDLYVEGPPELIFGKPVASLAGGGRQASFRIPVEGLKDVADGGIGATLTLTLVDGPRTAERQSTIIANTPNSLSVSADAATVSLPLILALALLGGLILNLMPCVLPVLSIKLLGVIGHGGGDPREVRLGFVASAAGIVTTFLGLATVLILLKQGGASIGWGIQFQQPWFLTAMALLVTLFACNLWGWFDIRLPQWLNDLGATGAGRVHGLGGHFLTGVFATLLATPCSAPFLGTAVGFALARGAVEILAVFLFIGLGLALPYLLVAARPTWATRLPRPGAWMVTLKKILGFALAATAVWLVSVMVAQVGRDAAVMVGGLLLLLSALFALRARLGKALTPLVTLLAVAAFVVPADEAPTSSADPQGLWQPFDEAAIAGLIAEGKIVFVDVTADWCLTCQVNKAAVLQVDPVHARLNAPEVVAMKADWTRPSETIAAYLAQFGRYGIPFNAVYGAATPDGQPLPELLTSSMVLEALDRARGVGP
ncbi:protein-disulfide reductase DsbD family protein [Magnetospira thiophila]